MSMNLTQFNNPYEEIEDVQLLNQLQVYEIPSFCDKWDKISLHEFMSYGTILDIFRKTFPKDVCIEDYELVAWLKDMLKALAKKLFH